MNLQRVFSMGIIWVIIISVVAILVAVGLFFLFRAITLWYFKINAMLKELKKANAYLARIAAAADRPQPVMVQQGHPMMPGPGAPVQPPMQGQGMPVPPMQPATPAHQGTVVLGQMAGTQPQQTPVSVFQPGASVVAPEAVSEAPDTSAPASIATPEYIPAAAPVKPVVAPDPAPAVTPDFAPVAPSNPAPAAAPVQPVIAPVPEMKRTCVNCGAVLQDGAIFCMECGTRN